MYKDGISAKTTLYRLQRKFPHAPFQLKDIHNLRADCRREIDDGFPPIQALLQRLGQGYIHSYSLDKENRVNALLFHTKDSLDLLRLFPWAVTLDCTYKTNKHNLHLLNIVGMTYQNYIFVIGQALLSSEQEEDFEWVISWLRDVY